ncbi:MAG: ABC transporter permease [Chloroflexi bacterium]|nr:ABC transporter permease [Chloroflexota bacterium]
MLLPIHIATLEVKLFLADRGELGFSIALPIVLFALMQGIGSGASFSGTAHIVNLDEGPLGDELVTQVGEVDGVTVKRYSQEDLDAAIDRSAVLTGFVIPARFTETLEAGEPVSIAIKQRGAGGDEGQIVSQIVEGVARGIFLRYEVTALASGLIGSSNADPGQIAAVVGSLLSAVDVNGPTEDVSTGVPMEEDTAFADRILPGILMMFLMFAVTLSAQTIVEERTNGTLERLMTTRLGIWRLFWGKFLAGIARAMVQAIVLLGLAFIVLRSIQDDPRFGVHGSGAGVVRIHRSGGQRAWPGDRFAGQESRSGELGGSLHHDVHGYFRGYVLPFRRQRDTFAPGSSDAQSLRHRCPDVRVVRRRGAGKPDARHGRIGGNGDRLAGRR